jgi:CDGSH iron-sulfur domain-containing protein 3
MKENKEKKSEAVIEVIVSGPLKISGNFILKDLKRNDESAPGEILLCRCGKSSSKPFCDGSHKNR